MLYPSINQIRSKADSRYTIVVMAAKRARDVIDGKPILTEDCHTDKPVSVAACEIAEDLITYDRDEDLCQDIYEQDADTIIYSDPTDILVGDDIEEALDEEYDDFDENDDTHEDEDLIFI